VTIELTKEREEPNPLGPLQNPGRGGGLVDVFRRR
jgi:hypothetical protein